MIKILSADCLPTFRMLKILSEYLDDDLVRFVRLILDILKCELCRNRGAILHCSPGDLQSLKVFTETIRDVSRGLYKDP